MRIRSVISPLIAGAAVVVLASPMPASAADTPVTVQVSSGTLDISVPAGPVNLGTVAVSGSPQQVSSLLGNVTVTDGRGGTAGWTATASAVDFTGPQNISVSAPGSSSYTTPAASVSGTANVTASDLNPLYPRPRPGGHRRERHQLGHLEPDDPSHRPRERAGGHVQLDDHPLRRLRPRTSVPQKRKP